MAEKGFIELLKALRERTGAGMMDCKRALEESDNDIEKAIDLLREKGVVKAASKASRIAAEGLTSVKVCEGCRSAVILEINCETDFVSASDKFHDLVEKSTALILEKKPATLEEARELTAPFFADAAIALGEKMELRRYEIVSAGEGEAFASYIHMGGKISVLALLSKETEIAKPLAMSIAANSPSYCKLEDIPSSVRDRETAIATEEVKNDPKLAGKPEEVKAGIVQRKVDKTLSASCFYLQKYVMDESVVIGDLLKKEGLEVVKFFRFQVGEGIEKAAEAE